MNTSIVSADAKTRLQEAVKNYTPPAPEKYRALEEVKECIIELRGKKASYQTITTMLHDAAGVDVSHQTVARYCREVLESKPAKKSSRSREAKANATTTPNGEATEKPSSSAQRDLLSSGNSSSSHRSRGPRIANVKNL